MTLEALQGKPRNKPERYLHIKAWGHLLHSHDYYIRAQQERAANDGAPLDSVFYDVEAKRWAAIGEVADSWTRHLVEKNVEELRKAQELLR